MSVLDKAKAVLLPKLPHLAHLFTKLGAAIGANMVYGLLCVRLLPVADYAKFAVLFGFMGTITLLLDAGVTNTLTPMVGTQVQDLRLIADCVASIRRIALKAYLIVAPVAGVVFILIVHRQHWPGLVVAQMLLVLLVTAWFARVTANYGSTLILLRDRNYYYRTQIVGSVGSLALLLVSVALHQFNIYVAILLNVAQTMFIGGMNFRRVRQLLGPGGSALPKLQTAILRLATPNFPSTLFYAFQGQLTLSLIVVFGRTASVANVGALGRLSQIFVIFNQVTVILIEPFFARLAAEKLKRYYMLAIASGLVFCAGLTGFAFLFPGVFLWLLGPNYRQLRIETGLVILGGSCAYMYSFLWLINTSRRFVYWWTAAANIILVLLVESVFIFKMDLSSVRNVLTMNAAAGLASLLVMMACGIYGFWRGPRSIDVSSG